MKTLLDWVMWLVDTWPVIGGIHVARNLSFDTAAAPCSFAHLSKASRYSRRTRIATNYPALPP